MGIFSYGDQEIFGRLSGIRVLRDKSDFYYFKRGKKEHSRLKEWCEVKAGKSDKWISLRLESKAYVSGGRGG